MLAEVICSRAILSTKIPRHKNTEADEALDVLLPKGRLPPLYEIGFGPRGDNLISDCKDMRACEVVIINSASHLLITANLTGGEF